MDHEKSEVKWPDNKKSEKKSRDSQEGKNKKKFTMPPSIVIILAIVTIVIFLTWILQGQTVETINGIVAVEAVGILSMGNQIVAGFTEAAGIIFYLFVLGWFLDVVIKSRSLESGIKSMLNVLKGKEIILVPLLFVFFAFGGTTYGMQEETLAFFIIIIPFFLVAGFDTVTGLLIILLGTTTGIAASVINPFSVGVAYDSIPIASMGDGIFFRMVILILFSAIGITFVTYYAWRVKKDKSNSLTSESYEEDYKWAEKTFETEGNSEFTKRQKWGVIVFGVTFLIMFLGLIPWQTFISGKDELWDPTTTPAWISWLIGFMNPIGWWDFGELITLFTISTIILGIIFKMKSRDLIESFWTGAKDMLSVAILIGVARAIPSVMSVSSLDVYLSQNIANGLADVSGLTWTYSMFFVYLGLGTLIPSTSGLASATFGLFYQTSAGIFTDPEQLKGIMVSTVIVYSIAIGIINMIIPTQAVVMASAERSRVSYTTMIKPVSIYMGMLVVATLAIVIPGTMLLY